MPTPTATDFAAALQRRFQEAHKVGSHWMYVTASDLHREVGGYPASDGNHRMPLCVRVMRESMSDGDSVLCEPPSGTDATLTIRYLLPRP